MLKLHVCYTYVCECIVKKILVDYKCNILEIIIGGWAMFGIVLL